MATSPSTINRSTGETKVYNAIYIYLFFFLGVGGCNGMSVGGWVGRAAVSCQWEYGRGGFERACSRLGMERGRGHITGPHPKSFLLVLHYVIHSVSPHSSSVCMDFLPVFLIVTLPYASYLLVLF